MTGIFRPHMPAAQPPAALPKRYGRASCHGTVPTAAETASVTRQMGRMMVMEEGNTSDSSSGVRRVSRGTSTMPPPAPNSPATAPAARPENAMPSQLFFFIANTTPWKFFHGVRFYAASGECALERRKNANL